mgnify:CR=1 FL=1
MVSIIKTNGALSTPIMSLNIGGWSGIINHAAYETYFPTHISEYSVYLPSVAYLTKTVNKR